MDAGGVARLILSASSLDELSLNNLNSSVVQESAAYEIRKHRVEMYSRRCQDLLGLESEPGLMTFLVAMR